MERVLTKAVKTSTLALLFTQWVAKSGGCYVIGGLTPCHHTRRRASVFPFQKCVNSVSGFANSVFYRFRFAKFRFLPFQIFKIQFYFEPYFCCKYIFFQHSFSFSILIKKFYSVTVLR